MGQAANVTNDTALDTVITNALIVDAVAGIIKADVGIKVCPLHQCAQSIAAVNMMKYRKVPHKGLARGGKGRGGDPNAI